MTTAFPPEHLSLERLGDHADGAGAPEEAAAAAAHLAGCASCRARLDALRALLARAAAAPRGVEPPRDLWPAVRARIAARPRGSTGGAWWHRASGRAAAAAVVALVASAGAATVLVRDDRPAAAPRTPPPAPTATVTAPATAPAPRYRRLDAGYAQAVAQLSQAVVAERGRLAPATAATVERSLRTIDDALAESRAALEHDPDNPALVELFAASYEQKLALLKRAAELSSDL